MLKSNKYARDFQHMIIPANRVCAYGLRVLFVFLLSNAGLYYASGRLSTKNEFGIA